MKPALKMLPFSGTLTFPCSVSATAG